MKSLFKLGISLCALMLLASCSEMIKKEIANNPELVFEAIKKNPKRYVEVVQEAIQKVRQEEQMSQIQAEIDEGFKNPLKPVTTGRVAAGDASAPITIVEFSDLQCPACRAGAVSVEQAMKKYPGKVKLVLKHLPLERIHPHARRGAEYFEAIALQDAKKAYDFKKQVFARQAETKTDKDGIETFFQALAKGVGVDMGKLTGDLKSKNGEFTTRINADMKEAMDFKFNGTPAYIVNGVALRGAVGPEVFQMVIDRLMKK